MLHRLMIASSGILFLYSMEASAQKIPNGGFETWHDVPNSFGGQDPNGWTSSNDAIPFIGNPIIKSTDKYRGSFAAAIHTYGPIFGYYQPMELVNGVCGVNADYSLDIIHAGTPIASSPATVSGHYIFTRDPSWNDTAMVVSILKKWNTALQKPDTIAIGSLTLQPVASYTPFQVNFQTLQQGITPDSIIVVFMLFSADSTSGGGSSTLLTVDEISVSSLGVASSTEIKPFVVCSYPNPFSQSTQISFTSESAGYADISIVNLLGEQVARIFSGELDAGQHNFTFSNTAALPDGVYECLVRMNGRVETLPMVFLNAAN
jgi:hypothetical protein